MVVFCGAHSDGHYWPQFLGGEYGARRATVLDATNGKLLWTRAIGYRIRPLVVGDTLIAFDDEPVAAAIGFLDVWLGR